MSVYMVIGICGDARFKERAGERGGGVGSDTASGYNFPLFLVYPVDMPGTTNNKKCIEPSNLFYV